MYPEFCLLHRLGLIFVGFRILNFTIFLGVWRKSGFFLFLSFLLSIFLSFFFFLSFFWGGGGWVGGGAGGLQVGAGIGYLLIFLGVTFKN